MSISLFGRSTSSGLSSYTLSANNKYVSKFTLPQASKIRDLVFLNYTAGGSLRKVKGVIYADAAGVPGDLLATTEELVGVTYFEWETLSFSSLVDLAAGDYHLGLVADGNLTLRVAADTGTNNSNANTYTDNPSDPFGTLDDPAPTGELAIYANYVYGNNLDIPKASGYSVIEINDTELTKAVGYAVLDTYGKIPKAVGYAVVEEFTTPVRVNSMGIQADVKEHPYGRINSFGIQSDVAGPPEIKINSLGFQVDVELAESSSRRRPMVFIIS